MVTKVFMNGHALIILATLWTFLVVPNLCTIGMLPHACEKHASEGCGHESDCGADPCAKFASSGTTSLRGAPLDSAQPPLVASVLDTVAYGAHSSPDLTPQPHPPRASAPAPGNCLPLLI